MIEKCLYFSRFLLFSDKRREQFITPTVHEMARDEARHGKAFAGLLNRYFAVDLAVDKAANFASKAAEVIGNVLK